MSNIEKIYRCAICLSKLLTEDIADVRHRSRMSRGQTTWIFHSFGHEPASFEGRELANSKHPYMTLSDIYEAEE